MKVSVWLKANPELPPTARTEWSLDEAADALLARPGARDLFVVDGGGRLLGHVSHRRIAELLLAEHRPYQSRRQIMERVASGPLREIMDPHIVAAGPEEELDDVVHRLLEQGLEDLPVIDAQRRLLGVVNLSAVLRELRSLQGDPFG